jgi:hypothetical protein
MKAFVIAFLIAFTVAGCTITPPLPDQREIATYSGNSLNGGIVAAVYHDQAKPSEAGFIGFLVTQSWVDEYNALASNYGYLFIPRTVPGVGIEKAPGEILAKFGIPSGYLVDAQRMVAKQDLEAMPLIGADKEGVISKVINTLSP